MGGGFFVHHTLLSKRDIPPLKPRMPITPFHLGPGAAFKAIGGRHFSFVVFGGAQVLMDLEPLVGLLRGSAVLHGYTHTLAGALVIGIVAALTGKPIGGFVLARMRDSPCPIPWTAAISGAFVGTFSHIAFDAVMHGDMRPWWPLSNTNHLLRVASIERLHLICLALGAIGIAAIAGRALLRSKA